MKIELVGGPCDGQHLAVSSRHRHEPLFMPDLLDPRRKWRYEATDVIRNNGEVVFWFRGPG